MQQAAELSARRALTRPAAHRVTQGLPRSLQPVSAWPGGAVAATAAACGNAGGGVIAGATRDTEERHGFAGALRRLGVWGPCRGPHVDRGAPRVSRGAPKVGGLGAMSGPPCRQRSAPGFPGRSERWGVWGALSGPPTSTDRGHLARV